MINDQDAMQIALRLAEMGSGYVSPNPLVGAIIRKNGAIISSGYHHNYGNLHAEAEAVKAAGNINLEGADIILNLEPCSHQGKQPPCVDLLIEKKFQNVIVGMRDPNPLVSGSGIRKLEETGIKVTEGILEEECKWLNRFFIRHITTGMPYVIAKIAQSLNGAITFSDGGSKWISSEESRTLVHKMRHEIDAVAVGKNTVISDNPELTVRMVNGRNPRRVIFDSRLEIPLMSNVLSDDYLENTIVVCSELMYNSTQAAQLADKGISLVFAPIGNDSKIDLEFALKQLYSEFKIGSILVEGGSRLHNSLFAKNLLDEIHVFITPAIISGGLMSFIGDVSSVSSLQNNKYQFKTSGMTGVDTHLVLIRRA